MNCKHFAPPQPTATQGTATIGPFICPWCEIDRLRGVLSVIAGYGEEDNEWDAVERYKDVREMAGKAVSPLRPEPQPAEHK